MYGKWYVSTEPGIKHVSPICAEVIFTPGTNQHNFYKILTVYLEFGVLHVILFNSVRG